MVPKYAEPLTTALTTSLQNPGIVTKCSAAQQPTKSGNSKTNAKKKETPDILHQP